MARIVTYECTQCGSEVVVTESLGTQLSPIYCCGIELQRYLLLRRNKQNLKRKQRRR